MRRLLIAASVASAVGFGPAVSEIVHEGYREVSNKPKEIRVCNDPEILGVWIAAIHEATTSIGVSVITPPGCATIHHSELRDESFLFLSQFETFVLGDSEFSAFFVIYYLRDGQERKGFTYFKRGTVL